ncbi:MAG: hypothetical protein ACN6RK_12530, partial [Stenotrophomonas sp.]
MPKLLATLQSDDSLASRLTPLLQEEAMRVHWHRGRADRSGIEVGFAAFSAFALFRHQLRQG